jgi:hypothetical protein
MLASVAALMLDGMRRIFATRAAFLEVFTAAVAGLLACRVFMGWNWSDNGPFSDAAADTRHGIAVGVVAALGLLWLGLRGRPILGSIAVFVPIVAYSYWRLAVAASQQIDASLYPIALAILVVLGGTGCVIIAGLATGVRVAVNR